MMTQEDFLQLQSVLGPAQNILIVAGKNPNLDSLGAALALHLALSQMGKTVSIACPEAPTVGLSHLVGADKVQNELGGANLIVSFPYTEGSIEKVSYNIEGDRFNLVIQPHSGAQKLSPEAVKFLQGGASAELIFILGAMAFEDLGHFYEKETDFYHKTFSVVIDHRLENKRYGKINFVHPQASSTSEIVGQLLTRMGINFDPDVAHNLLAGIDFATQNFSAPQTSIEAFEIATVCLKAGAKRIHAPTLPSRENVPQIQTGQGELRPRAATKFPTQKLPQDNQGEAPSDWLTPPKIFKGSDLL